MRIDLKLSDHDPAAESLAAIPAGERSAALRILLRRHASELAACLAYTPAAPTPTALPAATVAGQQGAPKAPAAPTAVAPSEPRRGARDTYKRLLAQVQQIGGAGA